MEAHRLVNAILDYCNGKAIHPIYSKESMRNVESGELQFQVGDLVLFFFFIDSPTIANGRVVEVTYNGFMSLGRKYELNTVSDLDETHIQKENRRLQEMKSELTEIITYVACENELEVTGLAYDEFLNQFDQNIDIVSSPVIFTHVPV